MLKPPVAHDGYGRVASVLGTWALVAVAAYATFCVGPNLLLALLHGDDKGDRASLDLQNLRLAVKVYRDRHGGFPAEERWAETLVDAGILEREPLDPWDRPYHYRLEVLDGGGLSPCVMSFGRDGETATDDDVVRCGVPPSR